MLRLFFILFILLLGGIFRRFFCQRDITQKEIAYLLRVTPSAVSQYINKKRSNFSIKPASAKLLRKSVCDELEKINESDYNKKNFFKLFEKIVQNMNKTGLLCKLHLDFENKKKFDCMDD